MGAGVDFVKKHGLGFIIVALGLPCIFWVAGQFIPPSLRGFGRANDLLMAQAFMGLGIGLGAFVAGFLPLFFLRKRPDVAIAIGVLIAVFLVIFPGIGAVMMVPIGLIAFVAGIMLALYRTGKGLSLPNTFGSSRWATYDDVHDAKWSKGVDGLRLGQAQIKHRRYRHPFEDPLAYHGDRHLLTVAPTRSGKGVSAIIPNLLTYHGAVLVIDPKGENALITAKARMAMGQQVYLLDPWDIAASKLGLEAARFNPLDWLTGDDEDIADNAMLLADALIMPAPGGDRDPFWNNEAKALLYGFLLYLATETKEADQRHLGRLRDILMLPETGKDDPTGTLSEVLGAMATSKLPSVRGAVSRYVQKADKERASVMSSAQSQTDFLESPRVRASLSASDFSFDALKSDAVTVYLILPSDRLHTYGRWLRLLIQQAITVNARNIEIKPERPILFLLDEMPALGHLQAVEQAYGLMAGFGMQLWGIAQDLAQLKRIYGDGWETFVSNAGVLQYFGSRDQMTAEYFSKLCGVTTVWNISTAISTAFGGTGGSESTTRATAQRALAYPDELMTLRDDRQIVLIENSHPIQGIKIPWFKDYQLKDQGVPLTAYEAPALEAAAPDSDTNADTSSPDDHTTTTATSSTTP